MKNNLSGGCQRRSCAAKDAHDGASSPEAYLHPPLLPNNPHKKW